jgi:Protein of unknown function (DUF4238)
MAEYKKNHSVPRFMLEYWVDPSTPHKGIHVHEIATRRTYVSAGQSKKPFSFAITTDLYVHTTNDSRAVGLERWFSGLESSLAVFVRQAHMRESISYTSAQECTKVLMAILGLECRSRYNIGLMQATLESDNTLRFLMSGDLRRKPQQVVLENIVNQVHEHVASFTPTEMTFFIAPVGQSWLVSDRPYVNDKRLSVRLVVLTNQILLAYRHSNFPRYQYREANASFLTEVNKQITLQARDWLAADSAAKHSRYISRSSIHRNGIRALPQTSHTYNPCEI